MDISKWVFTVRNQEDDWRAGATIGNSEEVVTCHTTPEQALLNILHIVEYDVEDMFGCKPSNLQERRCD